MACLFCVCCLDVCFYLFVFLFKWVLRLVFRVFFVCYVLLSVLLVLFLHFLCLFCLIFGNCVRFWVVQNVLRLDLLFFLVDFSSWKFDICFHFHLKSSTGSKIPFTLLFVHWFFTREVLHLFVEYTCIYSPFSFLSFCIVIFRLLGRWMSLFSSYMWNLV